HHELIEAPVVAVRVAVAAGAFGEAAGGRHELDTRVPIDRPHARPVAGRFKSPQILSSAFLGRALRTLARLTRAQPAVEELRVDGVDVALEDLEPVAVLGDLRRDVLLLGKPRPLDRRKSGWIGAWAHVRPDAAATLLAGIAHVVDPV